MIQNDKSTRSTTFVKYKKDSTTNFKELCLITIALKPLQLVSIISEMGMEESQKAGMGRGGGGGVREPSAASGGVQGCCP